MHNLTARSTLIAASASYPSRGLTSLDWLVITTYMLATLVIGWYYSRHTVSTGDYLLGGRKINSLSLGLSLFATLLSAITYLALPGEMVKYGPIFAIGKVAAYPLVAIIVGWFLIPRLMALPVTSVYEILEARLGLSVRILGSTLFLTLRLMWMAVVIYATAAKVIVPLMGMDQSATPYVCAIIGAVTIAYTSMGGLRAVVLTDVIQSLILFGGIFVTLGLITYHFGGVDGWWPSHWPTNWPSPKWVYDPDPNVRTFAGAFMATILWFVCTQGSDQMTVQRFLAGRDLLSARKTLIWSLLSSAAAALLLTLVGMALLAYFQANPQYLSDGKTAVADADRLYPIYIAYVLPPGFSGLVMSGLLAAAMSSLSSGINSACSVIIVDFVDRFVKKRYSEAYHVRLSMYVSVLVGVVAILLSMCVGVVQGNLLAIAFKVCNLLTAPLFGLMFMAMFVRWATVPGTLIGAVCGMVVVIGISFWKEITGSDGISFFWAMPLGLTVQISAGSLASLLPLGRQRGLVDLSMCATRKVENN